MATLKSDQNGIEMEIRTQDGRDSIQLKSDQNGIEMLMKLLGFNITRFS